MIGMKIERIVVGAFEVNCYLLFGPEGKAVVIDPGDDADAILNCLEKNQASVESYCITHGHTDHLSALSQLSTSFPAATYMHPRDASWAFTPSNAMPPYYKIPGRLQAPVIPLSDGQILSLAGFECRIIATPGHSAGSVCFHIESAKILFTGDTLFAGSVGRTDLPGGNEELLFASLGKLIALPEETIVLPGHGPRSTIAQEKMSNPYLR